MGVMKRVHAAAAVPAQVPASPLASIDLNLLVALDALLIERSVTRAARRLGITQSALSHLLGRLRALLGDPLLVKAQGGMTPTVLAQELAAPLRSALAEIEHALRVRPRFLPETSQRQFTVACADYGMLVLLPHLMRRLGALAPGVSVTARPATASAAQDLLAGQLDLVIGALPPEAPDLLGRKLFDERFVCLVRRDHPQVGDTLTLEQYVALPHLLISPMGGGVTWVDPVLERLGMRRHIALRVPHYLVAPLVVAETDLILTVAARVARVFGSAVAVREVVPPLEIPGFAVSMYWHPQRTEDPGHRWLREQVAAVASAVACEPERPERPERKENREEAPRAPAAKKR